jgi:hypothetical protein
LIERVGQWKEEMKPSEGGEKLFAAAKEKMRLTIKGRA